MVVTGNLGSPSKTVALAAQILEAIAEQATLRSLERYQLADLAPLIGPARTPQELGEVGKRALRTIESADILIAVTPVYKASYTGLFKHLFDLIEPNALSEVPVILGATGGGDKHALIIEHQLRPLFGFFGASTIPTGVYAAEQGFDGTRFVDPVVLERIERAARQALELFRFRAEQGRQVKAA
ncbi:MAG: NAD(P)H-dependent oxidoreductase [Methylotetracoccus sp.]